MKNRFRALMLSAALIGAAVPVIAFETPGAGAASTTTTGTTTGTTTTTNTTTTSTAATTGTTTTPAGFVVKTQPATKVTSNSATLSGTVTPVGATTCYFEYGTTTSYGLQTAAQSIPASATGPQSVGATLTGLESKTPFHYQMVCSQGSNTSKGGDQPFTTTDHGPSSIRLRGHTGFVSSSGDAGVFVGCSGDRNCTGSLSLIRNGVTIGHRAYYFEYANNGGIVHVHISGAAMKALKSQGRISVTVSSTTTQGQKLQPGDDGYTVKLHLFG